MVWAGSLVSPGFTAASTAATARFIRWRAQQTKHTRTALEAGALPAPRMLCDMKTTSTHRWRDALALRLRHCLAAGLPVGAMLAAAPFGACAGTPPGTPAPSAEAQAFLAAWRQALAQPGGEAIAELTAYPFLFESRLLARQTFVAQAVPALFKPAARRCLQRTQPLPEDGRLVLSCAPYGYVFGPTPAGWRLIEFFVDTP
ncbi:MAG: hypothetical protein QM722_05095 [Piscinibacter sp.]